MLPDDNTRCCGCGACVSVCPFNAIKMIRENGFEYPKIDQELCKECNMCSSVCPVLSKRNYVKRPIAYICKSNNPDVVMGSSSGGAFYELAKAHFQDNSVVYGAEYDDSLRVIHKRENTLDGIKKLCTSKYVQSNTAECLDQVIQDLKKGINVLFSGTPCQIVGLRKLCDKKKVDQSVLTTIGVICHGVPSPELFSMYVKWLENKYNSKIIDINMREKSKSWHRYCFDVKFENGKEYKHMHELDPYFHLFINDAFMRESCFECACKGVISECDIIIGDAWGGPRWDKKGLSLVICMSQKGEILIDKADIDKQPIDIELTRTSSPALYRSSTKREDKRRYIMPDEETYMDFFDSIKIGVRERLAAYGKYYAEMIGLKR